VFLLAWDEGGGRGILGRAEALIRELLELARARFGASTSGADVAAVVRAQLAVLPGPESAPRVVPLEHDVPAYIASLRALVDVRERPAGFRHLAEHGPGELRLEEARTTMAYNDFTAPFDRLEAPSNVFL
jgi:hypothetical protein